VWARRLDRKASVSARLSCLLLNVARSTSRNPTAGTVLDRKGHSARVALALVVFISHAHLNLACSALTQIQTHTTTLFFGFGIGAGNHRKVELAATERAADSTSTTRQTRRSSTSWQTPLSGIQRVIECIEFRRLG